MSRTEENEMSQLLELETDFGLSLLRQQNLNESLVFSPLSISLALSLLHVAANGQTKDQIREALAKGVTDEQIEQHYSSIMKSLKQADKGTEVNIANRIFVNQDMQVKQSYLDKVENLYSAGAESLNFDDKDITSNRINEFVSNNTGDHIKEMVKSSAINSDIVAFLVNALYFKAKWLNKFKPFNTLDMDFFKAENESRTMKFLTAYRINRYYAENDVWQMIHLPYKDQEYSFNVFLPKNRFGLQDALMNINGAVIKGMMDEKENKLVNIRMPKMKIESELKLKDSLKTLGIQEAFTDKADLSNLADGIFVSKATHKALIEVDEEGTTAAAATTIEIMTKSAMIAMEEPIEFTADHPFLFVLAKDGHPLFIGVHN